MISEETRSIIEDLKKIEGECRGVSIQSPLDYVALNHGEEKALEVENQLEELGIPTRKKVKALEKYPIGYMTITHLVIKDILSWSYDDIKKMGFTLPQLSFIVRTLSRYFLSAERTFQETPVYWKKHFTIGKLVPFKINTEKGYLIIRIENYKTHPVDCFLFQGYFSRMISYTIKTTNVSSEETECNHRGGDIHEFVIKWEV